MRQTTYRIIFFTLLLFLSESIIAQSFLNDKGLSIIIVNARKKFKNSSEKCVNETTGSIINVIHSSLGSEKLEIPPLNKELFLQGIPILIGKKKCLINKIEIPVAESYLVNDIGKIVAITDGNNVFKNCGNENNPYSTSQILINYLIELKCPYVYSLGSIEGNLYCIEIEGSFRLFRLKNSKIELIDLN